MSSINRVICMGNITRDPELRYIPDGSAVCEIGLALNNKWTDSSGTKRESVDFVNVVAWKKTAENLAKYMHKGSCIFVEGRLKQESWEKDGVKRSTLKIVAERIQFIGVGKKADGEGAQSDSKDTGAQGHPADAAQPDPMGDIPF